jgi:hypothetical protein
MEQNLISKKDLLELTGISYGQLYRWKRKNLIPEDWFIKKSSFTGQETFFPKEQILARIDKIINMKEDLSLDDLADVFSPNLDNIFLSKDELMQRNIVAATSMELFIQQIGEPTTWVFEQLLSLYVLDKLLQNGEINLDEGNLLLQVLKDHYLKFQDKRCDLIFIRKLGVASCCLVSNASEVFFEANTKIVANLSMAGCIEELKIKLG